MRLWILLFLAVFFLVLGISLLIGQIGEALWPRRRWRPAARSGERSILKDEAVSDIPWLDETFRPVALFGALRRVIEQADLPLRPVALLLLGPTVAMAAGYALSRAFHPDMLPIVIVSAAFGGTPFAYVLYRRRRRFEKFRAQLPEALDLIARALRAGHTVPSAIEMVAGEMPGPIAGEFKRMSVEQRLGLPFGRVVSHLARRVPLAEVKFFTAAVLIQTEVGGDVVKVLENLSGIIRQRFKLQRHVHAVSAHGRLSGTILCVLPVALGLLMYLSSPDYLSILFAERIGRWLLWGSALSQVLGVLFIRRITRLRV
jgi:tight adherence protein B